MLTIFALPKPFRGHIATIQRNAIESWMRLLPLCEILLFGDEGGTEEIAKEFGIRHVPEVLHNEYGTPLLNDVFEKAERLKHHDLLCYVNCDIILMSDFMRAAEKIHYWTDRFLMVGECWNLNIVEPVSFGKSDWEERLKSLIRGKGKSRGPWAIDYFVFRQGLYREIPRFALGRGGFDNWLVWKARVEKAFVIDVSRMVLAVHQDHDYSHVQGGRSWSYRGEEAKRNLQLARFRGEEAKRNLQLAGGRRHYYQILDCTHRLAETGVKRHVGGYFRIRFRWQEWKMHMARRAIKAFWRIVYVSRPMRKVLGLTMENVNVRRMRTYLSTQKSKLRL